MNTKSHVRVANVAHRPLLKMVAQASRVTLDFGHFARIERDTPRHEVLKSTLKVLISYRV